MRQRISVTHPRLDYSASSVCLSEGEENGNGRNGYNTHDDLQRQTNLYVVHKVIMSAFITMAFGGVQIGVAKQALATTAAVIMNGVGEC